MVQKGVKQLYEESLGLMKAELEGVNLRSISSFGKILPEVSASDRDILEVNIRGDDLDLV